MYLGGARRVTPSITEEQAVLPSAHARVACVSRARPPLVRPRTCDTTSAGAATVVLVVVCGKHEKRPHLGHDVEQLHDVGLEDDVDARAPGARMKLVIIDDVGEKRLRGTGWPQLRDVGLRGAGEP